VVQGDGSQPLTFVISPDWRYDQDIYCDRAGYTLNGGNTFCGLYLAVECAEECVYTLGLQMENRNTTAALKNVPIYLTEDDYFTGSVTNNQIKYFYYPVSANTGDTVIFLNKTGPLGKNGDSRLLLSIVGDATNPGKVKTYDNIFDTWSYPNST
jgi:hypothetical protein